MPDGDHTQPTRRPSPVRANLAVAITVIAAVLFLAGTVLAPVLERGGESRKTWGSWLRALYAPVCHQMPERALEVSGGPQAVCARCTGLYAGGIAGIAVGGTLAFARRRVRPVWIAWTLAPSVVDFGLGLVGLPSLPNVPRLMLAVPAGVVLGVYLAMAVRELAAGRGRSSASDPVRAGS